MARLELGPKHPTRIGMHLHQPTRLLQKLWKPSGGKLALVDHVDVLACNTGLTPNTVVIFDDIQRNIQPQHAFRLHDQVAQADLYLDVGQLVAMAGGQPRARLIDDQRPEERRVGKEWVRTCRSRWWPTN